jgi:hypothetical protein
VSVALTPSTLASPFGFFAVLSQFSCQFIPWVLWNM